MMTQTVTRVQLTPTTVTSRLPCAAATNRYCLCLTRTTHLLLLLLLLLAQAPEGAGLHMQYVTNATLRNTTFAANTANRAGGGLAALHSSLAITSSSISHNTAQLGGGLAVDSSQVHLQEVTLDANTALLQPSTLKQQQQQQGSDDEAGSATSVLQFASMMYAEGSAGGLLLQRSTLTVRDGSLTSNSADWDAGALLLQQPSSFSISSSTFGSNTAREGSGGGLVARGGGPAVASGVLSNCSFAGNSAAGSGGSAVLDSGIGLLDVQYEQCTFDGNTAGLDGGGVAAMGPTALHCSGCDGVRHSAAGSGGWMSCQGCRSLILQGSSSSGNQAAAAGGAVSCSGCGVFQTRDSSYSSNAASNGGGLAVQATADVGISGCQFAANRAAAQELGVAGAADPLQRMLHQLPQAWQALYAGPAAEAAAPGSSSSSSSQAWGAGGAVFVSGAGAAVLVSNTLNNNSGSTGGAIYASVASACQMPGQGYPNSTQAGSSSSSNASCQIQLANVTATDNAASLAGGVLYTSTPQALLLGTEVITSSSSSSGSSSISVQPASAEQQRQLLQQLAADNSAGGSSSADVDSYWSGAASSPVRLSLLQDADSHSSDPVANTGQIQQQQQQIAAAGVTRGAGRRLQQFGGRGLIINLGIASESTIRSALDAVDATSAGAYRQLVNCQFNSGAALAC
jgi:hypothetical protein